MVSDAVIAILKNALGQVSVLGLTPDEEKEIEELAKQMKTVLDKAVDRLR